MDSQKFSVRGHTLGERLQKRITAICEGSVLDQKSMDIANWVRRGVTIEARNRESDEILLISIIQSVMLSGCNELRIGIAAPDADRWHISITTDGEVGPMLHSDSLENYRSFLVSRIHI